MKMRCEICAKAETSEMFLSDIGTAFVVCETCRTVLGGMQRDGSFVKFDEIPQDVRNEIVKGECGGWDTMEHMTEGGELIYVLANENGPLSQGNVMIFCRSCFGEYVNSEK